MRERARELLIQYFFTRLITPLRTMTPTVYGCALLIELLENWPCV